METMSITITNTVTTIFTIIFIIVWSFAPRAWDLGCAAKTFS